MQRGFNKDVKANLKTNDKSPSDVEKKTPFGEEDSASDGGDTKMKDATGYPRSSPDRDLKDGLQSSDDEPGAPTKKGATTSGDNVASSSTNAPVPPRGTRDSTTKGPIKPKKMGRYKPKKLPKHTERYNPNNYPTNAHPTRTTYGPSPLVADLAQRYSSILGKHARNLRHINVIAAEMKEFKDTFEDKLHVVFGLEEIKKRNTARGLESNCPQIFLDIAPLDRAFMDLIVEYDEVNKYELQREKAEDRDITGRRKRRRRIVQEEEEEEGEEEQR